jgi:hypothetical protein
MHPNVATHFFFKQWGGSPILQEVVIHAFHWKQSQQADGRESQLKKACLNKTVVKSNLENDFFCEP